MDMMNALILREYNDLVLEQTPRRPLGADDIEIAVCLTGICGSDIHGYTGENGRRAPGQIMGHESEGLIASIGSNVPPADFPLGRRVTFNPVVIPREDVELYHGREQHSPRKFVIGVRTDFPAAFADYVTVPSANVLAVPDGVARGVGALIEPLAVAVHAVSRSGAVAGHRALVIGGGPIGQSLVIALLLQGVTEIIVSEPDSGRRELVRKLGALAVDPAESPTALSTALESAWGDQADVAFDAVGVSATLASSLSSTSLGGTVCLVGMGQPDITLDAYAVSTAERSIVGSFTYSGEDFRRAAALIGHPGLGIEHLISEIVPASQAPEAFARLARGEGPAGKILVDFETVFRMEGAEL
jgi:threonine dehydrogenase-like Zn-dependent dehydrogenase